MSDAIDRPLFKGGKTFKWVHWTEDEQRHWVEQMQAQSRFVDARLKLLRQPRPWKPASVKAGDWSDSEWDNPYHDGIRAVCGNVLDDGQPCPELLGYIGIYRGTSGRSGLTNGPRLKDGEVVVDVLGPAVLVRGMWLVGHPDGLIALDDVPYYDVVQTRRWNLQGRRRGRRPLPDWAASLDASGYGIVGQTAATPCQIRCPNPRCGKINGLPEDPPLADLGFRVYEGFPEDILEELVALHPRWDPYGDGRPVRLGRACEVDRAL